MPPIVALAACLVFILFLIRYDIKRNISCSIWLWVPIIWFLVAGARPVSLWINPHGLSVYDEAEGSLINKLVDVPLILASLIILFRRNASLQSIARNNKSLFIFYLFCGISILWSDYPFISFKRYIKAIGNIFVLLVVYTEPDPIEAMHTLIRRCAYIILPLSICLIKYFPLYGRSYNQWTGQLMIMGATDDKNALGRICMIFGIFYLWSFVFEWRKKYILRNTNEILIQLVLFSMALWLLFKSDSATSLFCFILGLIMIIALKIPFIKYRAKYLGTYILVLTLFFYLIDYLFNLREIIVVSLGRNMTLTERDMIWKTVLRIGTNPWIGTGFESFWLGKRLDYINNELGWIPNESHNGYLEIYLSLGIIGIIILLPVIISFYINFREKLSQNYNISVLGIVFLISFLFYNITESAIRGSYIFWSFLLLLNMDYRGFIPVKSEIYEIEHGTQRHFT